MARRANPVALLGPAARTGAVAAVVAGIATMAAEGCGPSDRPPELSDGTVIPDASAGDGFVFGGNPAGPPPCTLDASAGVCGCLDLTPFSDAPNIYVVLDRSGSMNDLNKWETIRTTIAQLIARLGPRASFGAAVFPDPNQDGCAPGTQVMGVRQGDSPPGYVGPTTVTFLAATDIPAYGGTPTASTIQSFVPVLKGLTGRTFVVLATDGGPNCNPYLSCTIDQCIPNVESDQGCSPGTPPNCCGPGQPYGALDCLDSQNTVNAVAAMKAAGIPVYVVGVPGSGPYGGLLDQMATVGGTARTSEPLYYAVSSADQQTFLSVLSQVAAKITATCTLKLPQVPPDPSLVNVYFDEQVVPQDPVNGWSLSANVVTLLGTSCQAVLNGDVLDVRVVAGCPTVIK